MIRNYVMLEETFLAPEVPKAVILHRIMCINDFVCQGKVIKAGTLGGFIEKYENLKGNAWCSDDGEEGFCCIYGNACADDEVLLIKAANMHENAKAYGQCIISEAEISGSAQVRDRAKVYGFYTNVTGNAFVEDNAIIYDAKLAGDVIVSGNVIIRGNNNTITKGIFKGSKEIFLEKYLREQRKLGVKI